MPVAARPPVNKKTSKRPPANAKQTHRRDVATPEEFRANVSPFSLERYEKTRESRYELIRQLVSENHRIDVLCNYVLVGDNGDPLQWFHLDMLDWQDKNPEGLLLAFRGVRKTSYLTIARSIFEIIKDPNVRILFVSDATDQAKTFLRSVKSHFENNDELKNIFGNYHIGAAKWADNEIIVNKRTAVGLKEATITCAGMETALLGRHFDIIIADDLVTGENSLTEGQREKIKNYYYRTLLPALEPRGRLWVIGTRWQDDDLYDHLSKEDFKAATHRLPVLDHETDQSIWEELFPTERMHRIRRGSLSAFNLQWMCQSCSSVGGIFNENNFKFYEHLPTNYFKWQGVDLAAGQKAHNDFFAHVTLVIEKGTRKIYLVDSLETKILFDKQVTLINDKFQEHRDTVRVGIEANAYQVVLSQMVRHWFPEVPVVPRWTLKDKTARAQQLAAIAAENGPFYIRSTDDKFFRRMLSFPTGPKDLFDAFDIAIDMSLRGVKKRRDREPGLI